MIEKKNLPSDLRSILGRAATYVPNLLTLCAVFCGLTSVRLSGEDQYGWAAAAIVGAVILDVADGFAARRLAATSAMGAELDSLADFLNFGVAPAMLVYRRGLHLLGWTGWVVAGFYVLATVVRLARFNIRARIEGGEAHKWFVGLPSTGAAVAILLCDGAANFMLTPSSAATVVAIAAIGTGALMVSKLRVPPLAVLLGRNGRSQ